MVRAAVWATDCPDIWTLAGIEPPTDELERRKQESALRYRLLMKEMQIRHGGTIEK